MRCFGKNGSKTVIVDRHMGKAVRQSAGVRLMALAAFGMHSSRNAAR
jgi:hypothetical protein